MKYRIYAYSYDYGWELCSIVTKEENILKTINNLSPYEYGHYIIVKQLKDRDEIYDTGIMARPNKRVLKPRK